MSWCSPQKQAPVCRRFVKFLTILFGIVATLFLVFSASILSPAISSHYPFHAQCQLRWTWTDKNCTYVHSALVRQVEKWSGPKNCQKGGEKCLYRLISNDSKQLIIQHTTPVRKYVDKITLNFCDSCDDWGVQRMKRDTKVMKKSAGGGCSVSGFSKSVVWYAVLDYGTNYCNMRNLAEGAGLTSDPGFNQDTDDDVCTQYSSADCEVY